MFGVGLAISIPLIVVAFTFDRLVALVKPPWKENTRKSSRSQEDAYDNDVEVKQRSQRSEETHRIRSSYDSEPETRPMRRSMFSNHRFSREDPKRRNSMKSINGDLERGNIVSYDCQQSHS